MATAWRLRCVGRVPNPQASKAGGGPAAGGRGGGQAEGQQNVPREVVEQTWGFHRLASETQLTPFIKIAKVLTVTIVTFIELLLCAEPLSMDYFI